MFVYRMYQRYVVGSSRMMISVWMMPKLISYLKAT